MIDELDRPFVPAFCVSLSNTERDRQMLRLLERHEPVLLPVSVPTPTDIPDFYDDMNFKDNPLYRTPPAIYCSAIPARRSNISPSLKMAIIATVFLSSGDAFPRPKLRGTGGLKDRIKSLEKTLQKHPTRNDIKLEILELRKQIRQIDVDNKKAREASTPKVKKRK